MEKIYDQIIHKLQEDKRPLLMLDPAQISSLSEYWAQALTLEEAPRKVALMKVLCILDHSQSHSTELLPHFIRTLREIDDDELKIFTLSASVKHVIEAFFRKGNPLPEEFIQTLGTLIETNKSPEVLEWLLRTIESCGGQSFKFKEVILKNRPGILSLLNKHNRNSIEIIDLLLRRWPSYGK